jgi:putative tryptophan/tyrosine transport system substrate-binding protein
MAATAQEARIPPVIGFLVTGDLEQWLPAFRSGLADLGWVEGQTIRIETRSAEGQHERVPALAAELVRLPVSVIVTADGTPPALAAKKATASIPIVFATAGDPIDFGIVSNLARPGGNITGFGGSITMIHKRLELLREIVPHVKRVAFLTNATNPIRSRQLKETDRAARQFGIKVTEVPVRGPGDFDTAFQMMRREGVNAVIIAGDVMVAVNRQDLITRVARARLPSVHTSRALADAGGLLSFTVDYADLHRKAAGYVDRILRGERPGELPVQEATKFEFVINLKTAKTLGLTIPPSVLLRADRVIE